MQAWINRYLEWMALTNYSELSVKKRRYDLSLLHRWCEERDLEQPQDITKPILENYQRHLFYYRKTNGEPLSFSCQAGRLTSVKGFFKWLTKHNYILYNPASEIELPKKAHRLPKAILNTEEIELLIAQPDLSDCFGLRDRAILEVFYSTGIRRMELASLSIYDLDRSRGTLLVHGKGQKDRVVPIGERALSWVKRYLDDVRPMLVIHLDEATLFLTYQGKPIVPDGLSHLVRQYIKQSGLTQPGSCHLFRHSMATQMLENGADIRFIQEMLGHANLETTQIYTQVSIGKLKAIHSATHPGANIKPE